MVDLFFVESLVVKPEVILVHSVLGGLGRCFKLEQGGIAFSLLILVSEARIHSPFWILRLCLIMSTSHLSLGLPLCETCLYMAAVSRANFWISWQQC